MTRQHARIRSSGPGSWTLEHVSKHNGVFLDGDEVMPGASLVFAAEVCHLQLGSVVFELKWLEETKPFTQAILPVEASNTQASRRNVPLFSLSRDGDCCVVHCKGKLLSLKPSCALALYALYKKPGEVVHGWDMLDEMGGEFDLPQAISGIRREFRGLIDSGWLASGEVIESICETSALVSAEELSTLDAAALLRRFVMSRRGHGYALMCTSEKISLGELL